MKSRLRLDIETFSRIELKKTGVYRYAYDPSFLILMVSWSLDGSPILTFTEPEDIIRLPGLLDPDVLKVAHNAQFERICFSSALGRPLDNFLPAEQWHCTQAVAGEKGYPQKLETLARAIGGEQKDSAGTRLINIFSKPNRKGTRTLPEDKPEEWARFIDYCEQDVATLIDADEFLGDHVTETERQVYLVDQRINDRGIRIDRELAQVAEEAAHHNEALQKMRVTELTGIENPGSVQQMMGWVKEQGLALPNMRAENVQKVLEGDLPAEQREVLELRQSLALTASKKYTTALMSVLPDNRLRGTLKFFGAHTGRWAGRGTQVHNLPRLSFDNEVDQFLAIEDLLAGEGASAEDLKRLVRPTFIIDGVVVDYSAIEAVVIAWLAGEEWVLQAFRDKRDIYVETAQKMGGLTRSQGKIAVLALGYNGGATSIRAMAGETDSFVRGTKRDGSHRNLAAKEGTDSKSPQSVLIRGMSDPELYEHFVYPWRNANKKIVKLWKMLDSRFKTGGSAGPHLFIEKSDRDRLLRLPSGRAIAYRKCGSYRDEKGRERMTFASPQGPYRMDTYGGRLAENATQAVARDLLAEALLRLEARGHRVVAHVHDEIAVENESDVDLIASIMCELPAWAEGIPVSGEGFSTYRYRKG